jgi:hypothetical protein
LAVVGRFVTTPTPLLAAALIWKTAAGAVVVAATAAASAQGAVAVAAAVSRLDWLLLAAVDAVSATATYVAAVAAVAVLTSLAVAVVAGGGSPGRLQLLCFCTQATLIFFSCILLQAFAWHFFACDRRGGAGSPGVMLDGWHEKTSQHRSPHL